MSEPNIPPEPTLTGARVQLRRPPVAAKVPGITAEPGTTVRLRLVSTSVADGVLVFEPVAGEKAAG